MKIDNPKAIEMIVKAIKNSELDCSLWDLKTCKELAIEIIVSLGSEGMFVVKLV